MGFATKKSLAKFLFHEKGSFQANEQEGTVVSLQQQNDEDLMKNYQAGNKLAFQVLLARHQRGVYNYIFRLLNQSEAAEEAFQEVFLRVIRSRHDYKPNAKFTTWLYTLARHYCIDQLRKRKHHEHASYEDEREKAYVTKSSMTPFSEESQAHEVSSANELRSLLESILKDLNPEQKEVFVLRELQGLPFDEIAKITRTPVNTVKSRMRYALQFLQRKFREQDVTPYH